MSENHEFLALDWVKSEIEETLDQAQRCLEEYIKNTNDSSKIRFCLTHLHQVFGSLQMMEFHGAALLAEELEHLCQGLLNGSVPKTDETIEILMQGILQLPRYLEKIQETRRDIPGLILPLLNDLRATRGENLLSGTALFNPDLKAGKEAATANQKNIDPTENISNVLRKIRLTYQKALVGVIRNQDLAKNLGIAAKIFSKMENLSKEKTAAQLWWVAGALVEGLSNGGVNLGVSTQLLLGVIDRHIKYIVESENDGLSEPAPEELLKNLLYYVGRSTNNSPRILEVKNAYQLQAAFEQASGALTSDREALSLAASAIAEELISVKETLDLYTHNKDKDVNKLRKIIPGLKKLSDTLAVLGMGNQRKLMQEQVDALDWCVENSEEESVSVKLLDVAGSILYLEASLTAFRDADEDGFKALADQGMVVSPEQLSEAQNAVIRESRAGLEDIKDAIVNFMVSQWDKKCLENIPETLSAVRGGLMMVPLERPSSILDQCALFIKEKLVEGDKQPAWDDMDTLADAISGVEYFLECLSEDSHTDESVLDIAAESISKLGYEVVWKKDAGEINDLDTHSDNDLGISIEDEDFGDLDHEEESLEISNSEVTNFEDVLDIGFDDDIELTTATAEEDIAADLMALDDITLGDDELEISEQLENSGESQSNEVQENLQAITESSIQESLKEDDDEVIDDEIIEIFIEEAGEVLETINEMLPKWEANWEDEEARAETRRAFHTLKGSGRMVGANEAGELAWAVENMMNRVIDKTINASEEMFVLINLVVEHIPELVKAFEERRKPSLDLKPFMEAADICAEGGVADLANIKQNDGEIFLDKEIIAPVPSIEGPTTGDIKLDEQEEALVHDAGFKVDFQELDANELFNKIDDSIDAIFAEAIEDKVDENIIEVIEDDINETSHEILAANDEATEDEESQTIEIDIDLLEVFTAEASSNVTVIHEFIKNSSEAVGKVYLSDEVLRALHTLKGSASMAGIEPIADLASPTEKISKEVAALNLPIKNDFIKLLQFCVEAIEHNISSLRETSKVILSEIKEYNKQLEQIRNAYINESITQNESLEATEQVLSTIIKEGLDAIFSAEQYLKKWQNSGIEIVEAETFQREMDILNQSAANSGLKHMAALCEQLLAVYNGVITNTITVADELFELLSGGHEKLIDMVDNLAAGQSVKPVNKTVEQLQQWLEKAANQDEPEVIDLGDFNDEPIREETISLDDELSINLADDATLKPEQPVDKVVTEAPDRDPEIVELFLEEATEILDESSVVLEQWIAEPENLADVALLQRHLHTLKGGARMAEIQEIGDLAHYLESLYESFAEDKLHASDVLFDILHRCHDGLAERVDSIRNTGACEKVDLLIGEIKQYVDQGESVAIAANPAEQAISSKLAFDQKAQESELQENTADEEIFGIFLEEAEELLENIESSIQSWQLDEKNFEFQDQLQRHLHTLKGGARLSELKMMGNAAHEFESFIIEAIRNSTVVDRGFFDVLNGHYDLISQMFEFISAKVKSGIESEQAATNVPTANVGENEIPSSKPVISEAEEKAIPVDAESSDDNGAVILANKEFQKMQQEQTESRETAAKKTGPQEMVRVPADLLEDMINLAGETSISRARVEKEVLDFTYILEEMGMTIERVQELLRRLNQETEEQILSRHEVAGGDVYADFDPLEMDRYSQLHQLSRSLSESSVDLLELRDAMANKTRDTETILLQQSRINTELQEGLMSSRLVPLSRLAPRLRRIVRQIGSELKKPSDLELVNADGELDRVVLERMVSPLEHMLRNAVGHGIEEPELRKKYDKPATGKIILSLMREGAEVVLSLADDGAGIDVNRVKEKAIERGLMQADSELTDSEILHFIFAAGFSTATEVTQISGRGVGMDVVYSEIKQLGGTVSIHSELGKGTTFTIRLPFTVSVNRALMVQVGEDVYAIPLSHIEGIVRVSPYELEAHYQSEDKKAFNYAGQTYNLQYLGLHVHGVFAPRLHESEKPLPVLLIRGAEHSVALQVDSVLGSREIVVKSVGVQLSTVNGISGATILGDGSVVIILDLAAMIRSEFAERHGQKAQVDEQVIGESIETNRIPIVMVVDDSVTVRKVTSRVLERNGYEVLLAKDGVDAITQLQEHTPDLMLLDIEMPRMDGFEVATQVRHDQRLKQLPIIMITSRTGQKHRERAMSIGVNEYLGKPFQEAGLLEAIEQFIGKAKSNG